MDGAQQTYQQNLVRQILDSLTFMSQFIEFRRIQQRRIQMKCRTVLRSETQVSVKDCQASKQGEASTSHTHVQHMPLEGSMFNDLHLYPTLRTDFQVTGCL
jgi:hypothetical protein